MLTERSPPLDLEAARWRSPAAGAVVEALAICILHASVTRCTGGARRAVARWPALPVSCVRVVPKSRVRAHVTTVANVYGCPEGALLEEPSEAPDIAGRAVLRELSSAAARPSPRAGAVAGGVRPRWGALGAAGRIAAPARTASSVDMGGTTPRRVIDRGEPLVAREFEVARADRFKKGSGLPIRVPVVELIEIGAGGGSIARVDRMGLLKVGPDSAGADPGPACYALGGAAPTVTDADLLLGYLDPDFFLGGRMRLDVDAARRVVEERVARPMGLSVTDAAWGIHRIVTRTWQPRRASRHRAGQGSAGYPLFAFGWGRPVHAWAWGASSSAPDPGAVRAGANVGYGLLPHRWPSTSCAPRPSAGTAPTGSRSTGFTPRWRRRGSHPGTRRVAAGDLRVRRSAEMRTSARVHEVG